MPPPRAAGGAAAKRPNSPGPKQPQPAATKAKASEPKASDGKAASSAPSEPKASEPKVAKSAKFKLGPPPTYPAPSVPPHRDFHQVLGPPPRRPPRPVTPRGDRVAPQIVISLRRHLIPRQQGKIWIAPERAAAETNVPADTSAPAEPLPEGTIDKSAASSKPSTPKATSRSRSRVLFLLHQDRTGHSRIKTPTC